MAAGPTPRRRAQIKRHRTGITEAEAAAVCGVDRERSAFQVWAEKVGLAEPNLADPRAEFNAFALVAPHLAQWYLTTYDRMAMASKPRTVKPDEWCQASIDVVLAPTADAPGAGLLELMALREHEAEGWDEDNERVPAAVQVRALHKLHCAGGRYAWCTVVAVIGGRYMRVVDVPRTPDGLAYVKKAELDFWTNCVVPEEPPTPDADAAQILQALWPEATQSDVLTLPDELVAVDDRIQVLSTQIRDAKKEKDALQNRIRAELADYAMGVLPNGVTYRWLTVNRKAYKTPATKFRKLWRRRS